MKLSAAEIESLLFAEQAADPATPASGYGRLYVKSDGVYFIDDAGTVTGPLGSGGGGGVTNHRARVKRSTDQALNNDTWDTILWDAEDYDTASLHDTATNTGRLTVPSAGYWRVTANLRITTNNVLGARLLKNGAAGSTTTPLPQAGTANSGTAAPAGVSFSTVLLLASADYVEVQTYITSGTSNLEADTSSFEIELVAT